MNKILLGMAAASAMLFATSANATLIVKIDEITTGDADAAEIVVDNSAGDTSSIVGQIENDTSTANFDIVTSSSFGSVLLPFPAIFDLSVDATSSGAGTLEVSLTETGLSGFDAAGFGSGGILLGGVADFELYVGSNDNEFEESFLIASSYGVTGSGLFSKYSVEDGLNDFVNYITGSTFSLTLVTTYYADNADDFFSSDTLVVPEPSMIALLSLGLVGLGFAGRRKVSK